MIADPATGEVRWHGRPLGAAVESVIAVPGTSEAVAVLDYMASPGSSRNLIRVSPDGVVRWRAELPTSDSSDAYVDANLDERGRLVASTWGCYHVVVDMGTGAIVESHFAK